MTEAAQTSPSSDQTEKSTWKISGRTFLELGVYLKRTYLIAKPYWTSPEHKFTAWYLTASIFACLIMTLLLSNEMSFATARLFDSLDGRVVDEIYPRLFYWTALFAVYIIIFLFEFHVSAILNIHWREFLTNEYLRSYLDNGIHNQLELASYGVDNPDQRIAMDLDHMASQTVSFITSFMRTIGTAVVFSRILWEVSGELQFVIGETQFSIPGYMFWIAVLYAAVSTWITHFLGHPLARLNFARQAREADFRHHLIRIRENAESIALLQGEARERHDLQLKFRLIRENFLELLKYKKRLFAFQLGLNQGTMMFPYLAAMPAFLAGTIAMGGFIQLRTAFGQVTGALSWFANSYQVLADWKSSIDRIITLEDALRRARDDRASSKLECVDNDSGVFKLNDLSIGLPDGEQLLEHTDFVFSPGEHVVVTGRSGAGKSTLFRAMSGQWVWGDGAIERPGGATMFLPQRPFLPSGALREALTYPAMGAPVSDDELRNIMRKCALDKFIGRLDEHAEWGRILSGGEQQRVSFVRAALQKPDWLLLDEATSALDPQTEEMLYQLLKEDLPNTTIISIAHRESLKAFHDVELKVGRKEGHGCLTKISIPAVA